MIIPDKLQKEFGEPLSNLQMDALLQARMEIRIIGRGKGIYYYQQERLIGNRKTHLFLYKDERILPEVDFLNIISCKGNMREINTPDDSILFSMNRCQAKDSFGGAINVKEIQVWLETLLDVSINDKDFYEFFATEYPYRYEKIKRIEAHIRAMKQTHRDYIKIGSGFMDRSNNTGKVDFGSLEFDLRTTKKVFNPRNHEEIVSYNAPKSMEILEITPMLKIESGHEVYEVRAAIPAKDLKYEH